MSFSLKDMEVAPSGERPPGLPVRFDPDGKKHEDRKQSE